MQMLRPTTSDQFRPEWIWNASYSTRETRLGWLYRRHGTVMVVIQLFQFLGQHEIHEWKIGIKAYSILLQRGPDWAGFIGYMGQWWWWWSRHRDRTLVILMLGLVGWEGEGRRRMRKYQNCSLLLPSVCWIWCHPRGKLCKMVQFIEDGWCSIPHPTRRSIPFIHPRCHICLRRVIGEWLSLSKLILPAQ